MKKIKFPIFVLLAYVAIGMITTPFSRESLHVFGIEFDVFNPENIKRIIRTLAYIFTARLLKIPTLLIFISLTIVFLSVWVSALPFVNSSAAMLLGWIVTRPFAQTNSE
jgi:hypothetical protein